jgi:hypothetical protein
METAYSGLCVDLADKRRPAILFDSSQLSFHQ